MLRGNYIVPTDYTEDDFRALADYAGSHKVVYAGYTILTPMPGTVLYSEIKDQIIDFDLSKYNFFNCVLKTKLPLEKFYENSGGFGRSSWERMLSELWVTSRFHPVILSNLYAGNDLKFSFDEPEIPGEAVTCPAFKEYLRSLPTR